jgi:hypothetical protein
MIHVMLPSQYLIGARARVTDPHKRLMVAVLQTVLDDCRGSVYRRARNYTKPVGRRDATRASAYMTSRDRVWPFSFENLCDALGLDAGRLRTELKISAPEPAIAADRQPLSRTNPAGRHPAS